MDWPAIRPHDFRHRRRACALLSALVVLAAPAPHVRAADELLFGPPPLPRNAISQRGIPTELSPPRTTIERGRATSAAAHQLWLVSTRRLPNSVGARDEIQFDVRRYDGQWKPATIDDLAAAEPGQPTVVLVHGNDTGEEVAVGKGLEVYRAFADKADSEQPFRLVIWSWPSDFVIGPIRADFRLKAIRADSEAFYVAEFVNRLNDAGPTSLVGFSLGARIVTGALHLLAGGELNGRRVIHSGPPRRSPLRAILMAAAVNGDWLRPGGRHDQAPDAVERLIVLVNPQDRILRWYRWLALDDRGEPLGTEGVEARQREDDGRRRITHVNVSRHLGAKHWWKSYFGSRQVVDQVRELALFEADPVEEPVITIEGTGGDASGAGG